MQTPFEKATNLHTAQRHLPVHIQKHCTLNALRASFAKPAGPKKVTICSCVGFQMVITYSLLRVTVGVVVMVVAIVVMGVVVVVAVVLAGGRWR